VASHALRRGRAPSSAGVGLAAVGVAAVLGVALAANVKIGMALMAALVFVPLAVYSIPLALCVWIVVVFLAQVPGLESIPNRTLLATTLCWIGLFAARRTQAHGFIVAHRAPLFAAVAFVGWGAFTALWAPVPGITISTVKDLGYSLLAFVLIMLAINRPEYARWLAVAFVAGSVLSVLVGIAEGGLTTAASTIDTTASQQGRFSGSAGDPNYLAAALVPGIMLAGGLAIKTRLTQRLALGFSVVIMTIGLAATQSRGGFIAITIAALLALVIWRGRRLMIAALLVTVVVALAGWFAASPDTWNRIRNFDDGGSGRTDIWTVAAHIGERHPIFGVGLSQFPQVSYRFVRQPGSLRAVYEIVDQGLVVHNVYLELWVETGLIGILLYLSLVAVCLRACWLAIAEFTLQRDEVMAGLARAALLALVSSLLASIFLSNVTDRRIWFVLAFGPTLLAIARRQAVSAQAVSAPSLPAPDQLAVWR
jgi:O-antigen ligase